MCERGLSSCEMAMSTVKITQRLHLWAEFDGAFYGLHGTQARSSRLKCEHYSGTSMVNIFIQQNTLFLPSPTSVFHKTSIKETSPRITVGEMARRRVWEYFYEFKENWMLMRAMWFIGICVVKNILTRKKSFLINPTTELCLSQLSSSSFDKA